MKRILIILLTVNCSLYTIHCSAQLHGQAKIDSLLKELPRQKEDTNQVTLLNELSDGYSQISPSEGIKYGQLGLKLATKLNWKKGIAKACRAIGTCYSNISDFPKAREYNLKALRILEELKDKKGIAAITCNIGVVYAHQGDYPKALEYYFKALKQDEEIGNKVYMGNVNGNIGIVYLDNRNYSKALEYFNKALKIGEELRNKDIIGVMTANISDCYMLVGDYEKGLEYSLAALKIFEETGDKQRVMIANLNIGNAYLKQKNDALAIAYTRNAYKLAIDIDDQMYVAMGLLNIGEIYISNLQDTMTRPKRIGNLMESGVDTYKLDSRMPQSKTALLHDGIYYMEKSLAVAKNIGAKLIIQEAYERLAAAYTLNGDYKKALEAYDNHHAFKDSIFSQDNKEQMVKLEMKDQYGRQRLTDSLKAAEKAKIALITLQKQKTYTYFGIAGIILLMGFSFFIVKERGKSEAARKQSDGLLLNILPEEVAEELKSTGTTTAKHYDHVTVLFTDFVNFTQAAEQMDAQGLIDELHTCFKMFDEITDKYNIEKIKTIGDAYLAVCGLPTADVNHAENIVKAAKEITMFMEDRLGKMGVERTFQVRIGIHSGSVVAGIVGVKKFAYDIWGDTVNTAARMEQNSEAGRINISETTYDLVKDKFACEYRGGVEVKGKGVMKMYFVG
ncbi:MAG: tetratricopeptide repeat protein [Taibaiella sp.]|nr:tetratricopeptide repeat protein [Taibaiella sp.]